MAIALVNSVTIPGSASGGTSAGIDMTGATILVMVTACYAAPTTIADSNGNTWNTAVSQTSAFGTSSRIYFAYNKSGGALSVGPGQTFTVSGGGSMYAVTYIYGFSGTVTTNPLDMTNSAIGNNLSSLQPGSITASNNGSLLISGISNTSTSNPAPTLNDSFTYNSAAFDNAVNYAGGGGYLIQATATPTNPSWSFGGSSGYVAATIASFIPAASASVTEANPHFSSRFTPPPLTRALSSWDVGGSGVSGPTEANPHFIPKFIAPILKRPVISWDVEPLGTSGPTEANPHQIGKFQPTTLSYQATLRNNVWDTTPSSPAQQGQADPHFVSRFRVSVFARVSYQPAFDPPVAIETNPHFVGRFVQSALARPVNTWDTSESASPPQQGQPDPHHIGHFRVSQFFRLRNLLPAIDGPLPPIVEAPPHYIGRFTVARLHPALNSWDTSAHGPPVQQGQAEPHFIGRFSRPALPRPISTWDVLAYVVPPVIRAPERFGVMPVEFWYGVMPVDLRYGVMPRDARIGIMPIDP
jgi:hypothetical protein